MKEQKSNKIAQIEYLIISMAMLIPLFVFSLARLVPLPADSPFRDPDFRGETFDPNEGLTVVMSEKGQWILLAVIMVALALFTTYLFWKLCHLPARTLRKQCEDIFAGDVLVIGLNNIFQGILLSGYDVRGLTPAMQDLISCNHWMRQYVAWLSYYNLSVVQIAWRTSVVACVVIDVILVAFDHYKKPAE